MPQIYSPKPDHHYRTEIPNIVFKLGLSLGALAVYSYLKNVAGDRGSCWKKKETICKELGISPTTYRRYRDELTKKRPLLNRKALLSVKIRKRDDKGNDTTVITIVDVWRENGDFFKEKLERSESDRGGKKGGGQNLTEGGSDSDRKQELNKKNVCNKKSGKIAVQMFLINQDVVKEFASQASAIDWLQRFGYKVDVVSDLMERYDKNEFIASVAYVQEQVNKNGAKGSLTGFLLKTLENRWWMPKINEG